MGDALVIEHQHPARRVDAAALRRLLAHVLEAEGCRLHYLGIVLADHATVLELNRTYLDHDYLTDVLSFRLADDAPPEVIDGEVYVDLDTAAERHAEFGASFEEEAFRYAVHGLLHLAGYDDATPAQKAQMHAREDRYLAEAYHAAP